MHILPGVVLVTETIRARDRVKENERVLLELVRDVERKENHEREEREIECERETYNKESLLYEESTRIIKRLNDCH